MRSSIGSGMRRSRNMMAAVVLGATMSTIAAPATGMAATAVNDLSRYCTACWRNAHLPVDSWADCTQDVFIRLLERVPKGSWHQALQADGEERREFIRAIDAVKKRAQRARRYVAWDAIDEAAAASPSQEKADRREIVDRAVLNLTERQQSIVADTMRGFSVPDIAARLKMTPERVSDEKYKAIRKLQSAVRDEA